MTPLQIAKEAAEKGAEQLLHYWGKANPSKKSLYDLVTEADIASEKAILSFLEKATPDIACLSEEAGGESADLIWVIDPLDGTTNYAHKYPFVAISIALVNKGIPQVAVVYNPIMGELFEAALGQGAKCNGEKLFVSKTSKLEDALLATGFPYDRLTTKDNNYNEFCRLTDLTQGVRRAGAASLDLAYVARGSLDGFWERGLKPWDMAAGALLVTESGGQVSNYDQSPLDLYSGKIVASNKLLHDSLSQAIECSCKSL